jgi:Transcriptional Coactivator p15 (PC4)
MDITSICRRVPNDLAAQVDAEPIEIAKFWANRGGDAIIVKLVQYHGRWCVDCRRYFTNKSGLFSPTAKGLMISVRKLPDLVKAITRAEEEANKRGLIAGGDE